jgi:hypothetical protein
VRDAASITLFRSFVLAVCIGSLYRPEAADATCGWLSTPSGDASGNWNILSGVSAISATDAWAAGAYYKFGQERTLTEHWDGTSWTVIPSANPSAHKNYRLQSVAAVSSSDVWAVGAGSQSGPLIEHWNGQSWAIAASTRMVGGLAAVAAISTTDVWAVGYSSGVPQTLIEHWNGAIWSIVPSPNASPYANSLLRVAAVSDQDVWAVGWYNDGTENRTLVEHWNGTQWAIVNSPNAGPYASYFEGVAAIGPSDIWATGFYYNGTANKTLTAHWNGTKWSIVRSPSPSSTNNSLTSVAAVSTNDVWGVGIRSNASDPNPDKTLTEHWSGTSWTVVPSPDPPDSSLWGVAAVSSGYVLSVGEYTPSRSSNGSSRTLTLLFECNAPPSP